MIYDNLEIDKNFLDMIEEAIEEIEDCLVLEPKLKKIDNFLEEVELAQAA